MSLFADRFELKLGEAVVIGRRLTRKEVKSHYEKLLLGALDDALAAKLVKENCTLKNGEQFDPDELSLAQLRELVSEMILPKEGRGISDFIGLLC